MSLEIGYVRGADAPGTFVPTTAIRYELVPSAASAEAARLGAWTEAPGGHVVR